MAFTLSPQITRWACFVRVRFVRLETMKELGMKNLQALLAVLGNRENLVEVANVCDAAYANGTGGQHTPFDADKSETVAQNLAGLQAVVSGVGIVATLRGAKSSDEVDAQAQVVLSDIATDRLSPTERSVVLRVANATWGAGQPFRTDKGGLGRATRMNVFDLLDQAEVDKDYHQIKGAANWLLQKVS